MSPLDLDATIKHISDRYSFTSDRYPLIARLSPQERKAFAVSHSVHHMIKSIGKLSGECEAFDHGGALNEEVLREATVKMFINTLKLAEEIGMTADDLIAAVPMRTRA